MIDEAIGKILGMVMAYGASALGMFVAYVNYRKRTVKAEKVMSPTAWVVVVVSLLAVVGGTALVMQLAQPAAQLSGEAVATELAAEEMVDVELPAAEARPIETPQPPEVPKSPPWVGIVVPAAIFLFATVITAALHRHFSRVESHG